MTFWRNRDDALSQDVLKKLSAKDIEQAIVSYWERCGLSKIRWKKRRTSPAIPPKKLRELFGQGRKAVVPMHPAKSAKIESLIASLTRDFGAEHLKVRTLAGLVEEATCLREDEKMMCIKTSNFAVPLQNFEGKQILLFSGLEWKLVSSHGCAKTLSESALAIPWQRTSTVSLLPSWPIFCACLEYFLHLRYVRVPAWKKRSICPTEPSFIAMLRRPMFDGSVLTLRVCILRKQILAIHSGESSAKSRHFEVNCSDQ